MAAPTGEITGLLAELRKGNRDAEARLAPLVYDELRRLARRYMRRERSDHTLQATALVHEAYIRLVEQRGVQWQNRAHFSQWQHSGCAASWWTMLAAAQPKSAVGRLRTWNWTNRWR